MPAPLAALGAGIDVGSRWVIRADPVLMSVSRNDVRIERLVDDLDPTVTQALTAMLSAHFAGDGLVFVVPRADAWFAQSAAPHEIETTPLGAAIGRPLRGLLPAGADAARWRRWLTEAQMLLHEQPFTGRSGESANGLWFSGGGVLPDGSRVPRIRAHAVPGRHGDLLRGFARLGGGGTDAADSLDEALRDALVEDVVVVVLAPVDTPASLESAAHRFVAPALARLDRGSASSLTLLADGPQGAARWHARRPSLLSRIARRRSAFVPPGEA
jgi:hypothetical protein